MATDIVNQQQGHYVSAPAPPMLSNLTEQSLDRATRLLMLDMIEERLKPCRIDLSQEIPEIEPLISIGDCCVCSRGNISAIVGEAKSKKTFLCTALIASTMAYPYGDINMFDTVAQSLDLHVAWMDTEQSIQHVYKICNRMNEMTGVLRAGVVQDPRLDVYTLREYDPKDRLQCLRDILYSAAIPIDIVVIDGISDLMYNTNDLEESDRLVGELMALSTQYRCHILCVLHTNPGSDKARGHLGSALQRKAESVLFVHRVGEMSVVEPQFCRNEPFERFAFVVNDDGIPELCNLPTEGGLRDDVVISMLREQFGGAIERKVLTAKLAEALGINQQAARMRISRAVSKGLVRINTQGVAMLPEVADNEITQ